MDRDFDPRRTIRVGASHSPSGRRQPSSSQAPAGGRRPPGVPLNRVAGPYPRADSPSHPNNRPAPPPPLDTQHAHPGAWPSSPYGRPMETAGMGLAMPATDRTLHDHGHQQNLMAGTSPAGRNPPLLHYPYVNRDESATANAARSNHPRLPTVEHLENRTVPGLPPLGALKHLGKASAEERYVAARARALPGLDPEVHKRAFELAWNEELRRELVCRQAAAAAAHKGHPPGFGRFGRF